MASISANADADINVTYEDQQKINKFACQNARLEDVVEELKDNKKRLQALEDAEADLLLSMEQSRIPYKIGDVFISVTLDEAHQMIEEEKDTITKEIEVLEGKEDSIKQVMANLKQHLYSKFGNNINLESE